MQPEPVIWKKGPWRAVLTVDTNNGALELPFNFNLIKESTDQLKIEITNAKEIIQVNKINIEDDNIIITLPVFDSVIIAQLQGEVMVGKWIKNGNESNALPFTAEPGVTERFVGANNEPTANITGKWEVIMSPDSPRSSSIIGIFNQNDNHLTGTFLTPTGDYRFQEGKVTGNKIMLSCFDGAHSFLFTADISEQGNLENGLFNSGSARSSTWRAVRNEAFTLPDPETLTFLKEGFDKLEFTFPDLAGNNVSLGDPKYQDKVVIVQIFGSWCPNCMDETRYLASLYEKYHAQGLEIIALAYEKKQSDQAVQAINRYKKDLNANYEFLLAGPADKTAAARTLPMLNHILSYPTAIFIDRQGEIQKIYTGFSGPGTGQRYTQFVDETEKFIQQLLGN
ncbi:MAG: TlpA family protein disulfide reductase [Planctomycetes bacterium]|nr:TlpA family protein disulfide reductase [Planctomycetota bacterium]